MLNHRTKFKVPTSLSSPELDFDGILLEITDAIDSIYLEKTEVLSFEKLYRHIYLIVINGAGSKLYGEIEKFMSSKLRELRNDFTIDETQDEMGFLKNLNQFWLNQCKYFKIINDLMSYFNKVYCKEERKFEVYDLCLNLFRIDIVIPLHESISNKIINQINKVRYNNELLYIANTDIWKSIFNMLETLQDVDDKDNYFITYFEPKFIQRTENFYSNFLNVDSLTLDDYLVKVEKIKSFENHLDNYFLNPDTTLKIISILDKCLVWNNIMDKVPAYVKDLIQVSNNDQLKKLYSLSLNEEYKGKIISTVSECILDALKESTDNNINDNTKRIKKTQMSLNWISSVLEIYNKYKALLSCMKTDKFSILNENLMKYLKDLENLTIESVIIYLDTFLKLSSNENLYNATNNHTNSDRSTDTIKKNIKDCTILLKFINEKDYFEIFYKKLLSKRLLQNRSNFELEKWLVGIIKTEMGSFVTIKIEGMLRDINKSKELLINFKKSEDLNNIAYIPEILTISSWPFVSELNTDLIILPKELLEIQQNFQTFYSSKNYNDRTLSWQFNLQTIELRCSINKNIYELIMPFYSSLILLLFNENEIYSTSEIKEKTNLPEAELIKQLLSLTIAPKCKILKKSPPGTNISLDDKFSINVSFKSSVTRIKVPTLVNGGISSSSINGLGNGSGLTDDQQLEQLQLEKSRTLQINASIVRIMKNSKTLTHNELYEKVEHDLLDRFSLTNIMFKKSIEILIEKEYLQRSPDDINFYFYVA
ncbi:hypothetical protein TBLA_0G01440 [Henningerozyma blattae CBS 6284]|uniref:Cullin family profile domain-containing protein n=1 Tax=Henningerozyma blattae (strain ATCC 34711 / CBS 6284 / DSM 70876 / NBRC 10599 / NRRL Y-10934 / UCD 77-7) TaxID=1071380 RepID=I2H6T8_HENB6|nr:hypothetical protein TBLA_0G01440 [Tetrapisispora blattae CBS 6284]CCH62090.1 hypothetical protein TBLA_0G01440 [Tetrapisispora blattae CBS 6284]